jgi:putative toxin-antitoxin system antitoxin component (TIGR02293 family)
MNSASHAINIWRERKEGVMAMNSYPEAMLQAGAFELLGGEGVLGHVDTLIDMHRRLQAGLPVSAWTHLRSRLLLIASERALIKLIGEPPKSAHRLSRTRSNRIWTFARLLARATDVFGCAAAAEEWFVHPAIALERRCPIDLLSTPVGVQTVDDHLTRMDFGVYA